MTVTLLQSTTDWVFYIINIATFLFCGISTIFRQDFDGASNESVTAMLYEWDRNGKIPKKKRKLVKPFRIARKVALAGLLIAIVLIIRKPLWILSILEESEYRKKLGDCRDFQLFIMKLYEREKIYKVKPLYNEDIRQKLIESGFHEKQDHVFAFTALAADKVIVTEDSDYGVHFESEKKRTYEYLTGELGLLLFDAQGFVKEI